MNFEWIIADDGSSDETGTLINSWKTDANFSIEYYFLPHRGRNATVNFAKNKAKGDFIIILDSDDAFLDDALEVIDRHLKMYYMPNKTDLAGIAFPYQDELGNLLYDGPAEEKIYCSFLDLRYVHKLRNDFLFVIDRNQYGRIKYIELPPPAHVPESIAHARLNLCYLYFSRAAAIAYRHDGIERLTNRPSIRNKPINYEFYDEIYSHYMVRYIWCIEALNYRIAYFKYAPISFIKMAINSIRTGLFFRMTIWEQYKRITPISAKFLWVVVLPIGMAKYLTLFARHGRADRKWQPESAVNY